MAVQHSFMTMDRWGVVLTQIGNATPLNFGSPLGGVTILLADAQLRVSGNIPLIHLLLVHKALVLKDCSLHYHWPGVW